MSISEFLKCVLEGTRSGFLKWRADENGFCETFLAKGERVILEPGFRCFQYHDGCPDLTLYVDNGFIGPPIHTFEEFKPELCWVSKCLGHLKSWLCPILRTILFIKTDWKFKLIKEERKRIDNLLREIADEVAKRAEVTIGCDKRIGMFRIDDQLLRQASKLFFAAGRHCKPDSGERWWNKVDGVQYRPWEHPSYQFEFDPALLDTLVVETGFEINEVRLIEGCYGNLFFPVKYLEVIDDGKNNEMDLVSDLPNDDLGVVDSSIGNNSKDRPDDFNSEEYPNAGSTN